MKITDPALPVDLEVVKFMRNTALLDERPAGAKNEATRGYGREVAVEEKPVVAGTDQDQRVDTPSVFVKLIDRKSGQEMGVWLLTTVLRKGEQRIDIGGKPYEMSLRFRRELSVLRRLVEPDREHIHHRLTRKGWSVRKTVFVLYAITLVLAGLALATARFD